MKRGSFLELEFYPIISILQIWSEKFKQGYAPKNRQLFKINHKDHIKIYKEI